MVPTFARCRAAFLLSTCLSIPFAHAENWPGWRGPRGDGSSQETGIATTWDATAEGTAGNIAWKVPLPGKGHSSPIVWSDRIFLTTCLEGRQERVLLCVDRKTGQTLWQKVVLKSPLEKKHTLNSFASSTPVTDGKLVYVTFLAVSEEGGKDKNGDMVVAAYDFDGNEKWLVRPGKFSSQHGYGASPVLFEDKLIVNGDHDGPAYIVALNKQTGETVWKTPRENNTRSYGVPLLRNIDGREQLILAGSKCVASYDPRDGSRHWVIDGPTEQFVATLVYNGKLLFMTCGFPAKHMLAIKPDGSGDVTKTHIAWRTTQGASYVPSPIAAGDYFLVTSDGGIGSLFVAETGERLWQERLGKHYSASPVLIEGLVYFTSDDGITKVVKPGPTLDVVAENNLGEYCYSSPAISQGQIFFRGEKHLICVGK